MAQACILEQFLLANVLAFIAGQCRAALPEARESEWCSMSSSCWFSSLRACSRPFSCSTSLLSRASLPAAPSSPPAPPPRHLHKPGASLHIWLGSLIEGVRLPPVPEAPVMMPIGVEYSLHSLSYSASRRKCLFSLLALPSARVPSIAADYAHSCTLHKTSVV